MVRASIQSVHHRTKLLLGLIGAGIQASRTPAMLECVAAEHGLRCIYQLIDLDTLKLSVNVLPDLITAAERMGFSGLNVTHPCKQAIIPFLTDLSEDARVLGAVNTIILNAGRRSGHNTDWLGFSASFQRGLGGAAVRSIVQLGAGGGGAATAYAMLKAGAGCITLVDTDFKRSVLLADRLGSHFGENRIKTSSDLVSSLEAADGLIHATPTGMLGHAGLPLPADLLRKDLWVADIVYCPLETELLRAARAAGCTTLDGSWMAVCQAAETFRLLSGFMPNPERMYEYFNAIEQCR
jgi:shikimate dehydrogenase